jgi:hypothetical protein
MAKSKGPYLDDHRLQDVLAALQFFANSADYDLTITEFREKIGFDPRSAGDWGAVLSEHPEFFRQSQHHGDYSLVLRRAKRKSTTRERPELHPAELSMLIKTAIHLQKHQLEMFREGKRLPILLTALGSVAGFAGAVLGAWLKG